MVGSRSVHQHSSSLPTLAFRRLSIGPLLFDGQPRTKQSFFTSSLVYVWEKPFWECLVLGPRTTLNVVFITPRKLEDYLFRTLFIFFFTLHWGKFICYCCCNSIEIISTCLLSSQDWPVPIEAIRTNLLHCGVCKITPLTLVAQVLIPVFCKFFVCCWLLIVASVCHRIYIFIFCIDLCPYHKRSSEN